MPVAGGSAPIAAAAISRKRRRIIRAFLEAGATGPGTAKTLDEVKLSKSLLLHIQKLRGVVVELAGGRYYLDVERNREVERFRRILVLCVAVLAVAAALVLWYVNQG